MLNWPVFLTIPRFYEDLRIYQREVFIDAFTASTVSKTSIQRKFAMTPVCQKYSIFGQLNAKHNEGSLVIPMLTIILFVGIFSGTGGRFDPA